MGIIDRYMAEGGCGSAFLQEPYATNGVVRGLPGGFRVFLDVLQLL